MSMRHRAYLLDDEDLALKRLARLLDATGRVEIAGSSTSPIAALEDLRVLEVDVLFLDIRMPELDAFAFLKRLGKEPYVIFTTAFDEYALNAFDVSSIAYLLKPVDAAKLVAALDKLDRVTGSNRVAGFAALLEHLQQVVPAGVSPVPQHLERVSSRLGDRIHVLSVAEISHFFAKDRLTFAALGPKDYVLDLTIQDLEDRLDPKRFLRVHRSSIVNLDFVGEVSTWFQGKLHVRLKNERRSEVSVSRDRAQALKMRLGI